MKDSIELLPASVDEKFSNPTPEDRWQKFSIRFKLIMYALSEEAKTVPIVVHSFLSQLTSGKLRIPEDFLLPIEMKQVNKDLGEDRRLTPVQQLTEISPDKFTQLKEKGKR